jgi:hypothetical protein
MSYDLMVSITGHTLSKIKKDMKSDKWLWAQEAVDYGLADHIGLSPLLSCMPLPSLPSTSDNTEKISTKKEKTCAETEDNAC